MTHPLVSILVPCYNAAPWLSASLESALGQTWPHCEIIAVNDGSTDCTGEILAAYAARGVRVASQANAGQCSAANHALRLARGDYVKFFDADDLLSPEMIERQVAALRDRPGCVAYGEWARFQSDPDEARFIPRAGWHDSAPADWLVEIWSEGEPMMQCALFLLPRALLETHGGWDERLSLINDFEFFARMVAASAGIVFTPGARLYYRSGLAGSLSSQKSPKAWRSAFLSTMLGTDHLLRLEDSPRTRRAASAMLQNLTYGMYPGMPDLVADLERRVCELGGSDLAPAGGRSFQLARRLLGWKAARRLQILAGKWPQPVEG